MNYQFETYFPKSLIAFSFVPLIIGAISTLLRPRNRVVLFSTSLYLFVFVAFQNYEEFNFFVHNIPFGSIFEAPSIFFAPAAIGLALLIGYSTESIPQLFARLNGGKIKPFTRWAIALCLQVLVILGGIPWWTGQTSGSPVIGLASKLNLYQIPQSYADWTNVVHPNGEFFVMYVPLADDVTVANTTYFSPPNPGVSSAIFTWINNLPYVTSSNMAVFLNDLTSGNPNTAEVWGSYSIKYIVVYTNVISSYNSTDLLNRLSEANGIIEVAKLPDVVVFQDQYAKPIVYANTSNVETEIMRHDPTSYLISATSTSPYLLVLNQAYSSGWVASINGTKLPPSAHLMLSNGFNGWHVNSTGTKSVNIFYGPQTEYAISLFISVGGLLAILVYLGMITLKPKRR